MQLWWLREDKQWIDCFSNNKCIKNCHKMLIFNGFLTHLTNMKSVFIPLIPKQTPTASSLPLWAMWHWLKVYFPSVLTNLRSGLVSDFFQQQPGASYLRPDWKMKQLDVKRIKIPVEHFIHLILNWWNMLPGVNTCCFHNYFYFYKIKLCL